MNEDTRWHNMSGGSVTDERGDQRIWLVVRANGKTRFREFVLPKDANAYPEIFPVHMAMMIEMLEHQIGG